MFKKAQNTWIATLIILLIMLCLIVVLLFKPPSDYEITHGILRAQTNVEYSIYLTAKYLMIIISVLAIIRSFILGEESYD